MVNPLNQNELADFVANSIVPSVPGGIGENRLVDLVPDMINSVFNIQGVQAGRLFDKDGGMVIEPLGADHLVSRKDSAVDRYVVRVDIIVDRADISHGALREIDQKVGGQLKLW